MDKVRLAIIGMGMIGKRHLRALQEVSEVELAGAVDPDPRTQEIAEAAGASWHSSAEELLGSTTPDGIIVSTPTELHLEPTLLALQSGCHVLVEKPIAATLEEAGQILEAAAQARREVLVGHHRRHYGLMTKAREVIQSGQLGTLLAVHGQWTTRKSDAYYDFPWRQQRSSGPVLINLIHEMDILRYVCGEVRSVCARIQGGFRGHPKEETAALVLEFVSGALGTFLLSDATPSPWTWEHGTGENAGFPRTGQNSYRFLGTEAALEFPNLMLWTAEGQPDWQHRMSAESLEVALEDAYVAQIRHFAAVIRGQEVPRISGADATRTLAATLAVFESAEQQRPVGL